MKLKSLKNKNKLYSKDFLTNLFKSFTHTSINNDISCYVESVSHLDNNESRLLTDIIKSNNDKSICFLINKNLDQTTCYISISKNIISSYNAKNLSKELVSKFDCKGGGNDTFATVIFDKVDIQALKAFITEKINEFNS